MGVMYIKHSKHKKIMKVVKEENLEQLTEQLNGIKGVAEALRTDTTEGIPNDEKEIARRKRFGSNTYKKPRPIGFVRSICRPLQEFAILDDFVNILAAFILFVAAYSIGSCTPSSAHKSKLINEEDKIEVLRGGKRHKVSISEIVVGDVVCLKIGDKVPADGLFLKGKNLRVESMTDKSENDNKQIDENNPFLFSGCEVVDGYGSQMMVTSVGMKAKWCEMMSCGSSEEISTIEDRVYELSCSIRNKVGLPVALLGFLALLARYFTGNTKGYEGNQEFNDGHQGNFFYSSLVEFIATAITTVGVVIPESLRLGVALVIFYSKKKMMNIDDMEMVSDLSGCETMASVTTICTNKTGILTMNQMKVTEFWVGEHCLEKEAYFSNVPSHVQNLFQEGIALNSSSRNSPTDKAILSWAVHDLDIDMEVKSRCTILQSHVDDDDDDDQAFNSQKKKRSGVLLMKRTLDNTVKCVHWKGEAEVILEMCSRYYDISKTTEDLDHEKKLKFRRIIQHMTERSLQCIAFAHNQVEADHELDGHDDQTVLMKEDGLVLLGLVGIKDPCRPKMNEAVKDCQNAGVDVKMITGDDISTAKDIAVECGILLPDVPNQVECGILLPEVECGGILLPEVECGILLPDVPNQVECGILLPEVECGILLPDVPNQVEGAVITGEEFRGYSENERMEKVDKIRVMASSSPDDKLLMVKTLKKKDHIVAVSGNSRDDVLAMLEADVRISMGIKGTHVGNKISNIIILDDTFESVATVLKASTCIYNKVQKFIQFQLTLNIAALVIIFISAVSKGEVPLYSSYVLWLNLIVNTLASLALATEIPTQEPIKRQPVGRKEPLISNIMLRNLLAQVVYQIVVVLVILFNAKSILGFEGMMANLTDSEQIKKKTYFITKRNTLMFHAFLLCQVFNEFNARNLEKKNVFKWIHRDIEFLAFIAITISVEVMFLEFLLNPDEYFERLKLWEWGICFGFGFISWPIAWVVKCIPVPEKPVLSYLCPR